MATFVQTKSNLEATVDACRPWIASKEYLVPMIEQSIRTTSRFPLKGIEHLFVKSKEDLCKYCGYNKSNINHVTLTIFEERQERLRKRDTLS